jgi:hypothetical protein
MLHDLNKLLEKFYALRPPQAAIRTALIEAIRRHCEIELAEQEIECRGNIAYLRTSPIARGEILMQREIILKEMSERHHIPIRDIR